jgi:hypothetical protein
MTITANSLFEWRELMSGPNTGNEFCAGYLRALVAGRLLPPAVSVLTNVSALADALVEWSGVGLRPARLGIHWFPFGRLVDTQTITYSTDNTILILKNFLVLFCS